jgi:ABC-type antimicrobial peptide transport system permease subunit
MFRNYILVTFRNLFKNRIFTTINIIGLGLALAVCIVAFFNNMFNYEFDRNNLNFDEIYRINSFRDMEGREQEYGVVPATLGLEIKKDIPGIKNSARLIRLSAPVKRGNDVFQSEISFVDPAFLDVFTFPLIFGEKNSIKNQGNVLLSRKMANTLFAEEYPVGKVVSIVDSKNKEFTYTVGAVFEDLPQNSSFRIDILTHFDNCLSMWDKNDADWKFMVNALFIQVPDKKMIPSISQSLKIYTEVQNKAREDFKINRWNVIPLKAVGANSRNTWDSGLYPSLHPAALIAPPIMAIFILIIACFNFANTSIAIFSRRLKEIGLRKTFGGQRRQLIVQFMFETFVICFLALLVGLVIAEFLVPAYSSLWAYMSIELTFTKYAFFWIFLVLLLFATGFIAGVYPAIHVSSFTPAKVIKGSALFSGSGKLTTILLGFQFTISVMSLVLGIVFIRNSQYQRTLDLGYDRDKLIVVPLPSDYYASFRNDILSNPKIISAEGTQNHIGWGSYRRPVKDEEKQLEVDMMDIGPGYPSTMGLKVVDGRMFDELRADADRSGKSVIVNQTLVNDFGWKEPVGKTFTLYDTTKFTVIGVVKDFYLFGLWQKIEPSVMRLSDDDKYGVLAVRAETKDIPEVLDYLARKWKDMGTNYIFEGRLQEDLMQEEKDINDSIMKVNIFLAIAATLLSLIGMYNMVSLDIIKRTKEIGIRKVQGAPVPLIMYLMSRRFIILIVIASIIGCVGGYYLSYMFLDSVFDYFVDINAGMMLTAVSIIFFATVTTIIFKITKAAMRNPVISLRYE